jgi:hypothetical protein
MSSAKELAQLYPDVDLTWTPEREAKIDIWIEDKFDKKTLLRDLRLKYGSMQRAALKLAQQRSDPQWTQLVKDAGGDPETSANNRVFEWILKQHDGDAEKAALAMYQFLVYTSAERRRHEYIRRAMMSENW